MSEVLRPYRDLFPQIGQRVIAPLGALAEFFAKNSANALCNSQIQGIYHATTSSSPPRSAQCF